MPSIALQYHNNNNKNINNIRKSTNNVQAFVTDKEAFNVFIAQATKLMAEISVCWGER